METRPHLLDVAPDALATVLADQIDSPFRAKQIAAWLYDRGVTSFAEMTDLSKDLRASLEAAWRLDLPEVVERTTPASDGSVKYLFRLADGMKIEAVWMPMGRRTTLCLSSQAGCAVGCTFCVTGYFGPGRNLTPAEIVGQVHQIRREHPIDWETLNIVFMGMGEPLLNFEHVTAALEMLYRNVSPRRITLSTSGIVPGIEALAKLERRPNLAISVNAPDQERRERIMPITRKYPLPDLVAALRLFPLETRREITAEYVLLEEFNDAPRDAEMLADLLEGLEVKVNAIPFNPDPNLPDWMKRPGDARIDRFAAVLVRRGVPLTVRRSKGLDIAAACGQLRGRSERTRPAVR